MATPSLFTKILDFPTGFQNLFSVSVNGVSVGQFGPGQSVDFSNFPGGGVSTFKIAGIAPQTDVSNPAAFPVKLDFNTQTASFAMLPLSNSVRYDFSGFLPPVSMTSLNSAKAGRTVALKWQLMRSDGSMVTALSAVLGISSISIPCGTGAVVGSELPSDTSGASGLRYDASANQFVYTWQTDPTWSGSCRRLLLRLDDGTTHAADFEFK